jgi:betaine reductase
MDLHSQEKILALSETHGRDQLVVILGAPDPEAAEISAETVRLGDPAYAGVLAGVQLGLDVYHVLDDQVREAIPPDVWDAQVGIMSDILEADALNEAVAAIRGRALEDQPEGT